MFIYIVCNFYGKLPKYTSTLLSNGRPYSISITLTSVLYNTDW